LIFDGWLKIPSGRQFAFSFNHQTKKPPGQLAGCERQAFNLGTVLSEGFATVGQTFEF